MKKIIRCKSGITLVEIVVTIAILGIIIVPISTLFVNTARANRISKDKMKATILAEKYMEQTKVNSDISNYLREEDGFNINVSIDELNEYEFSQLEEGEATNTEIEYDYRVEIGKQENKIILCQVFNDGIENKIYDNEFTFNDLNDGDISIKFINEDDNLYYHLQVISNPESTIHSIKATEGDVKIKVDNYTEIDIVIEGENNVDSDEDSEKLIFYLASLSSEAEYDYKTLNGRVKWLSNIMLDTEELANDSRVYNVTVTVKKDGKVIEELKGTKTFIN